MKTKNESELHKKAIKNITDKERELQVEVLELKSTLHKLATHNADYHGDSVMREIIENALKVKAGQQEANTTLATQEQLIKHSKEMFDTFIIIAERDNYPYAIEMIAKVSGRTWTKSELTEAAAVARSKYGITY